MELVRADSPAPFASILRVHEDLLRRGVPAVHVAVVRGAVVSVGVGVPEDAPYLRRAEALGVATARRSSGGTGILHMDRDLVWGIVLPRSDPRAGRDFVKAYPRLGRGLVAALVGWGLAGEWAQAPGLSEEYCPLGHRGEVLEVGGRIVGAAAQHLSGGALLHHGTLSLRIDRDLLARVFRMDDPAAADRLVGLEELGVRDRPERLADQVGHALVDQLEKP
jgi:lipoate-protein ligase A